MALRVTIENYKSIRHASIDLGPGLNILIGPNGSGKTCLLSALKFLRDVFQVGAARALARQGGALRTYHHGQSEMSFCFTQAYGNRTYLRRARPCQLFWEIPIAQAGPERLATITQEELRITTDVGERQALLFRLNIRRSGLGSARTRLTLPPPSELGRDLFTLWASSEARAAKSQMARRLRTEVVSHRLRRLKNEPDRSCFPLLAPLDRVTHEIYSSFLFLNEYNISPEIARASTEQLPFAQMAPDGGAVSEVIDALENKRYHKLEQMPFVEDEYAYALPYFGYRRYHWPYGPYPWRYSFPPIRRWRRAHQPYQAALDNTNRELAAAVRPITHVSVEIDPSDGKRFVVFKAGDEKFYPQEVSDGTVKWLCILVSLFVPFSKVYLLEEPENFLHPWMQQRLIATMREQAKQNRTIYLLSSHSSTILNAALPEEILIVKQGAQGTEVSAPADLESIKQALSESDFHLGDLWVSGAIGGVPADE